MKNNYNSCFPRWIIENLKLALFPWYIYKEVKKYFQKRRQEKAEREPYKHLYLPKGEFERRFPQYKKSRRKHFKKMRFNDGKSFFGKFLCGMSVGTGTNKNRIVTEQAGAPRESKLGAGDFGRIRA